MNEEILKKLGYNNIATQILLKREAAEVDLDNIFMPGKRPTLNIDPTLHLDVLLQDKDHSKVYILEYCFLYNA